MCYVRQGGVKYCEANWGCIGPLFLCFGEREGLFIVGSWGWGRGLSGRGWVRSCCVSHALGLLLGSL